MEPIEKLYLTTSDGKKIAANHFRVSKRDFPAPRGWVVLLHMMPATKESWNQLARPLQEAGYESIAIDLRGHGESDGGPHGFARFSDGEHQNSVRDIDAAVGFLAGVGARPGRIALVGASIGANLALRYIHDHRQFMTAVLFSPGLNYHGIETMDAMRDLAEDRHVLLLSAEDDANVPGNSGEVEALYNAVPAGVDKQIVALPMGGHGTDILKAHPDLVAEVVEFIELSTS